MYLTYALRKAFTKRSIHSQRLETTCPHHYRQALPGASSQTAAHWAAKKIN
jgi:hypothetical protein